MKLRLIALAAPLFLLGCHSIPLVTKDGAAPATASPSQATVVVVHPFTYAQVNLIDGGGKAVGQLGPRQYTVIPWPAGELKLAAFPGTKADRGDRVAGTVEAGKVYYVVVGFRMGGLTLQTVTPRNDKDEWNTRKNYLRDLSPVTMDAARQGEVEQAMGENRTKFYGDIDSEVSGWSDDEKKNRRVEPADGDPG